MHIGILAGGVLFVALTSTPVIAQNTLGELLDMGSKKVSKQQLMLAYGGANVSGPTLDGGRSDLDFKEDGTFSGNITTPQGKAGGMFGTWTVDDNGKFCTEYTVKVYNTVNEKRCGFIFEHAGLYFYIPGAESDRGLRVLVRTIKK